MHLYIYREIFWVEFSRRLGVQPAERFASYLMIMQTYQMIVFNHYLMIMHVRALIHALIMLDADVDVNFNGDEDVNIRYISIY